MLSEEENKAIEMINYLEEHNTLIGFHVEDRQKLANTLLNLITKLQKENEILKRAFDKQTADMSNNLLELQQKDKQIDLMARAFKQDDVRSVEEIKRFYERKVEDESDDKSTYGK